MIKKPDIIDFLFKKGKQYSDRAELHKVQIIWQQKSDYKNSRWLILYQRSLSSPPQLR